SAAANSPAFHFAGATRKACTPCADRKLFVAATACLPSPALTVTPPDPLGALTVTRMDVAGKAPEALNEPSARGLTAATRDAEMVTELSIEVRSSSKSP